MSIRKFIYLVRSDLIHALRDPALRIFLAMPLIIIPLLYWGLPALGQLFPPVSSYFHLILAMMASVTAFAPGFIFAFIMLDEKDMGVFDGLRVTPVSPAGFIAYRMTFMFVFGGIFGGLAIVLSGIVSLPATMIIILSCLIAGMAPLLCLTVVTFAKNKIEGVTLFKGLNMLVMLPLIIIAIDPSWERIAGLIPFYWTFAAFEELSLSPNFWLFSGVGLIMQMGCMGLIYWQFRKRVF